MGVPIYWLSEHFSIEPPVDGHFFIRRMAELRGEGVTDRPKNGPSKAPDFVTRDTSGAWHVIECKGTQSGNAYRNRQLGNTSPRITGAVAQKRTISFPSECTGQRLACGLMLAVEGDRNESSLRVIDPPVAERCVIDEDSIPLAVHILKQATASRTLRLAGFGAASSAVSWLPSTSVGKIVPEVVWADHYQRHDEMLVDRAREQLRNRNRNDIFKTATDTYIGREVRFDLVTPINIQAPGIQSLLLRYGVTVPFLDAIAREFEELAATAWTIGSISDIDVPQWHQMLGRAVIESDQGHATMQIGVIVLWRDSRVELARLRLRPTNSSTGPVRILADQW